MLKIFLVEAQLTGYGRVKDGSMNLKFRTNREISSSEIKDIDAYYQQNGHLAFKQDEITLDEIPDVNSVVPGAKSPSQRLRNSLWRKFVYDGGTKADFPEYYIRQMERFIEATDNSYGD